MDSKKCIRCKRDLSLNAFSRNISRTDGLDNVCRQCRRKMYLKGRATTHRRFPSEITDEELLSECKRRGLMGDEQSEADAKAAKELSA